MNQPTAHVVLNGFWKPLISQIKWIRPILGYEYTNVSIVLFLWIVCFLYLLQLGIYIPFSFFFSGRVPTSYDVRLGVARNMGDWSADRDYIS